MDYKAKENLWDLILFHKCGLLLWLVLAQHDHYESKRKSGGIHLPFHFESENETNPQSFICNRFCVAGTHTFSVTNQGELKGTN